MCFLDENFFVVVFSNFVQFNFGGMVYKVVDIYLKDKFKDVLKKKEELKEEIFIKKVEIVFKMMVIYVGKYELQLGFVIMIKEIEGGLEV